MLLATTTGSELPDFQSTLTFASPLISVAVIVKMGFPVTPVGPVAYTIIRNNYNKYQEHLHAVLIKQIELGSVLYKL